MFQLEYHPGYSDELPLNLTAELKKSQILSFHNCNKIQRVNPVQLLK